MLPLDLKILKKPYQYATQARLKFALVLLISLVLLYIAYFLIDANSREMAKCYRYKYRKIPNPLELYIKQPSIFFHMVSSNFTGLKTQEAKAACAVEAATRLNPNFKVYLFYLFSGGIECNRYLSALWHYPNFDVRYIDLEKYFLNTPMWSFWNNSVVEQRGNNKSRHFLVAPLRSLWIKRVIQRKGNDQSLKDLLQFVTLWRYGGVSVDTNVLLVKSISQLPENYVIAESNHTISSSIFRLTGATGRFLTLPCLIDLKKKYGLQNASELVTKAVRSYCNNGFLTRDSCSPFINIYPPQFLKSLKPEDNSDLKNNTYGLVTGDEIDPKNKGFVQLARKYCPKVFKMS